MDFERYENMIIGMPRDLPVTPDSAAAESERIYSRR
jgi:hypothetical protein